MLWFSCNKCLLSVTTASLQRAAAPIDNLQIKTFPEVNAAAELNLTLG